MVSKLRLRRINERMKEELATMLLYEVADPRLQGVTVTDVSVDRELAYADVFVSAVEGSERKEEILAGLEHARGFLRSQLAARVEIRQMPRLRFHWDPTPERAERIEQLLKQIAQEREQNKPAEEGEAPNAADEGESDEA